MTILCILPGCASCRGAKQQLKNSDMEYVKKNAFTTLLKEDEIKYLPQKAKNGAEDVISTRSKASQELHRGLDDISIGELVDTIQKNPSTLKRPITTNEKSLVVGYDDDEITAFVPAKLRLTARQACNLSCTSYSIYGRVYKEA